jgi:hypothetical protein
MDLSILDKDSFAMIRRWDLDNLEHVLGTLSNGLIKQHPFWYYLVPYDGLLEVLASMVMTGAVTNPIDVGLRMLEIESSNDPIGSYLKVINEARKEQALRGLDNILVTRYVRWCLAEQELSTSIYRIQPVAIARADLFSDPTILKTLYGDSWKKHYKPKGRAA